LYRLPLPQGHRSFLPGFTFLCSGKRRGRDLDCASPLVPAIDRNEGIDAATDEAILPHDSVLAKLQAPWRGRNGKTADSIKGRTRNRVM
jgi:hypothetical protein